MFENFTTNIKEKRERERKLHAYGKREKLTCMFMALHPPRRPTMCHARIVYKDPNSKQKKNPN